MELWSMISANGGWGVLTDAPTAFALEVPTSIANFAHKSMHDPVKLCFDMLAVYRSAAVVQCDTRLHPCVIPPPPVVRKVVRACVCCHACG
jgi:hypothetical protein